MDARLVCSNDSCSVPFSPNHQVMACNGAGEPLLSGALDPAHHTNNGSTPKRRRFRRCKSAPLANFVAPNMNGSEKLPRPESIFGKLHPNVKRVAVYLAVYLGVGTICFYIVQKQFKGKRTSGFPDSLYFSIVTMTTVGYGDLVPDSTFSKLLACVFVFAGMALGCLILSKGADYLVEKQEILLVKALHMKQKVDPTDMLKEIETNKVRYKAIVVSIVLSVLFLVGILFMIIFEEMTFVDALYCVCATITTLGYGDQSFKTGFGRLFASFWILSSTVSLGQFCLYIAELNTENRQRALVNWVLTRKMTYRDLEAADIDDDGVVDAAEFVIYKLKEMGKISQDDINQVMQEFEELDVDQSGTLSASDINLAQNSLTKR